MKRIATTILVVMTAMVGCSTNNNGGFDGGADAGTKGLGSNGGVPQNCQSCLAGSTTNECANKAKLCTGDSNCVALNNCVNNCTDINAGCVNNCGDTASADVQTEWLAWATCTCNTCSAECNPTFCGVVASLTGASDAGQKDGGSDVGPTCTPDLSACASDGQCCTGICSTGDGLCGCVQPGESGCGIDTDCCDVNTNCINNVCQ